MTVRRAIVLVVMSLVALAAGLVALFGAGGER